MQLYFPHHLKYKVPEKLFFIPRLWSNMNFFYVAPCSNGRSKNRLCWEKLTDILIHPENTDCRCPGVRANITTRAFLFYPLRERHSASWKAAESSLSSKTGARLTTADFYCESLRPTLHLKKAHLPQTAQPLWSFNVNTGDTSLSETEHSEAKWPVNWTSSAEPQSSRHLSSRSGVCFTVMSKCSTFLTSACLTISTK